MITKQPWYAYSRIPGLFRILKSDESYLFILRHDKPRSICTHDAVFSFLFHDGKSISKRRHVLDAASRKGCEDLAVIIDDGVGFACFGPCYLFVTIGDECCILRYRPYDLARRID